jgi:ABC-type Fe3+-citrate transport system substrate-binding protein
MTKWNNQINDSMVWLRIEAVDNGDCESVSVERWIRIDSTNPTITNTRK